jgi:hypothetical protein
MHPLVAQGELTMFVDRIEVGYRGTTLEVDAQLLVEFGSEDDEPIWEIADVDLRSVTTLNGDDVDLSYTEVEQVIKLFKLAENQYQTHIWSEITDRLQGE